MAARPSRTMTKSYRGSLQGAMSAFNADVPFMAHKGWHPVSQMYEAGSWGCGAFLIALLLCVLLVGILVFIYLLIVKPEGTLVVTYEYREDWAANPPALPSFAPDERECPNCGNTVLEKAAVCPSCGIDLWKYRGQLPTPRHPHVQLPPGPPTSTWEPPTMTAEERQQRDAEAWNQAQKR